MEDVLVEKLDKFLEHLLSSGVIGSLFFFFITIFLLSLFSKKARKAIFEWINVVLSIISFEKPIDWFNINLFTKQDLLFRQIKNIQFEDEIRTWLFTTILQIKVETAINLTHDYLIDLIKKRKMKIEKEIFINELRLLVESIIDTYETRIKEEYIKKFGISKGTALFKCVYYGICNGKKKVGFKEFHEENIHFINKGLEADLETPIQEIEFILYNFLNLIYMALSFAISDLYKLFKNFNGDLQKIIDS